jgi:hypothetical protein
MRRKACSVLSASAPLGASLLGAAMLLGVAGCAGLGGGNDVPAPAPVVDRAQTQAMLVTQQLEAVQRLLAAGPAEQAEIVSAAQRNFEDAPTPSRQLRYALLLGTPGHASTNVAEAAELLRDLMAVPEALVPPERALAQLSLALLEQQNALLAEQKRLQAAADRAERDRNNSASRRLQTEIEENARLRKQLEDAQKKLDAIANIEGRTP